MTRTMDWKTLVRKYGTIIVTMLVFITFSVMANNFFSMTNIMLLLKQMSNLTIISLGFTIVMAVGGFDMSIGFATGLISIVFVQTLLFTGNILLAILLAILAGLLVAFVNGMLVSYIGLPDFIGTFAVGSVVYGIKMMLTEGNPTYVRGQQGLSFDIFSYISSGMIFDTIPFMVLVMLFFVVLSYVLMEKTKVGRRIYAIGGNKEAALYSGINVKRYKFIAYLLCGFTVAITGILVSARLNSAQPTAGESYLMQAISSVYLSTTMFGDGQPTILGTVVGAFIISMLNNGLTMLGMTYYFQDITTGFVVILAVLMSVVLHKKK